MRAERSGAEQGIELVGYSVRDGGGAKEGWGGG